MKSFSSKVRAFALITLAGITAGYAAAAGMGGDLIDIQPTTLNFPKVVFDFSNPILATTATAACVSGLIASRDAGSLNPLQVAYDISEVFAGYVRANPSACPALSAYVSDPNAMYAAWGKGISSLRTASADLSALGDSAKCSALVRTVIQNDMPTILTTLGIAPTEEVQIENMLGALEPLISPMLLAAYQSVTAMADAGEAIAGEIEALVSSKCGCCFGGAAKPSGELKAAAAVARRATAARPAASLKFAGLFRPVGSTVRIVS